MSQRRLVVIGAGPVGLAAALGGVRRGLDVTVLEAVSVGAALRQWGPTRFFSPVEMNVTPEMTTELAERLPAAEALLTGPEFADRVLVPLATGGALAGRVLTGQRVIGVGRARMLRGDYAGHPLRGERPFQVLTATPAGERRFEADIVLDASGTSGPPPPLGALGERAAAGRLVTNLGVLHDRLPTLAGRRLLLIGNGHSAANALLALDGLAREAPQTRVVWAIRTQNLRPCVDVASDPLPERRRVVAHANGVAERPPHWLRVERRASVTSIEPGPDGSMKVSFSGSGDRVVSVDEILSFTGVRPDLSFLSELALEISPSTEGAARLAGALANVTDCLSVPAVAPAQLESGEPGFHLIGAKSYGRARTFLLKTGYAQLETILDGL